MCRRTPQISDAPMRVTQNTFMVGARSLHLLVMRDRFRHLLRQTNLTENRRRPLLKLLLG